MEFVLVAHAIIVGLAVAEILRGLADIVRAERTNISARLCFPEKVAESDLEAYYARVAPTLYLLVAATYAAFAFLLQPLVFDRIAPSVFVSQIMLVILAVIASQYEKRAFHYGVLAAMISQVAWRGLSTVIGSRSISCSMSVTK